LASGLIHPFFALSGLIVDLATGAVWQADSLEGAVQPSPVRRILVLPPPAASELRSEAMTRELEAVIRSRYPAVNLVTRAQEPALYLEYGLTYNLAASWNRIEGAAAARSATHYAAYSGENTVELIDIFSGLVRDRWDWQPKASDDSGSFTRPLTWLRNRLLDATPNTIGVSSRTGVLDNFSEANSGVRIRRTSSLGLLGTNLGISIGSARPRGALPTWGLDGRLVPSLGFSSSEIEVSAGADLRRSWTLSTLGLSYFGEVGVHTPGGYLFLGLGPVLTIGLVSGERTAGRTSVAFELESGWSFYLSSRLHIKVFSGARGVPEEFVRFMVETDRPVSEGFQFKLSELSSGILLEYVWPETRDRLRRGAESLLSRADQVGR
jgi:hypothetical protein